MDYALIPFALRKAGGHIVDVGEVQQGLACGCEAVVFVGAVP